MNRSDPIENCTVDFGTSIDRSGKVWVRFVFHEPDGTERAYAYDAADAMIGPLTTAIQVARSSNPSN